MLVASGSLQFVKVDGEHCVQTKDCESGPGVAIVGIGNGPPDVWLLLPAGMESGADGLSALQCLLFLKWINDTGVWTLAVGQLGPRTVFPLDRRGCIDGLGSSSHWRVTYRSLALFGPGLNALAVGLRWSSGSAGNADFTGSVGAPPIRTRRLSRPDCALQVLHSLESFLGIHCGALRRSRRPQSYTALRENGCDPPQPLCP